MQQSRLQVEKYFVNEAFPPQLPGEPPGTTWTNEQSTEGDCKVTITVKVGPRAHSKTCSRAVPTLDV